MAVDDLTFDLRPGMALGLLGPNGAGKTTTIRMLLGLARPTAGTVELSSGMRSGRGPDRIGGLVERPGFYPRLTAVENLRALAYSAGASPTNAAITTVLEAVSLTERGSDLVATYSHGMVQRLAIAAALVHAPPFLVLDEPGTGLDPSTIATMRSIIRSLKASGRGILLSSHQLAEVELLCDEIILLADGKVVRHGAPSALMGPPSVRIEASPLDVAIRALQRASVAFTAEGGTLVVQDAAPGWLNKILSDAGCEISGIESRGKSLEDLFLEIERDQR